MRAGLLRPHKVGRDVFYTMNHETLMRALEVVRNYVAELRVQEVAS